MADLDDFFAKKDRKKNKSTKKFSTTDEIAKKLEDNAKKTEKLKKERIPEGDESSTPVHDQDEWKDFEEEKKDYSGLKIGNLTMNTNNEGVAGNVGETNTEQHAQGSDEPGQESDRKVGPWKKIDSSEQPQVVEEPPKVVPEKKPEQQAPVTKSGAYVPPGMRNPTAPQYQTPASRLKSKAAPDIHNEENFPTLSGDYKKNRSEGSFEVVAHNRASSHRQMENSKLSSGQGPKLNLGNRYNTLSNDS